MGPVKHPSKRERKDTLSLLEELKGLKDAELSEEVETRRVELISEAAGRLQHGKENERRRFLRIPSAVEVQFRFGSTTLTCVAADLSMGGLLLDSFLFEFLEGTDIEVVNLRVEDQDFPLAVGARMVWKVSADDHQPRAGLEFLELSESAKRQIQEVFEHLLARYLALKG